MAADERRDIGEVFGTAAEAYERARPPYPEAAVVWLLGARLRRVLDLGAGTGKLTRQLVRHGAHVVAVEPSAGMREVFTRTVAGVPVLAGCAEEIPLPDDSVDVVLVAQAWHWVDVSRAVPEVARVLTRGGRLGLLWNIRDEREDWVARLRGILAPYGDYADPRVQAEFSAPHVGRPFGPVERLEIEWRHALDGPALLDLVASRSYIIELEPDVRTDVLAQVQGLLDTHPDLVGRDRFVLPYITYCYRASLV